MTLEDMVREFHVKYGHLVNSSPTTTISPVVKDLRLKLINEEYIELIEKGLEKDNLVEIADGIADLVYVLIGTALSYGIPFDRVFREVHRSNMTKTPSKAYEGQKYGAVNPKGPDFIPPHVWRILFEAELKTQLEKVYDVCA